MVATRLFGLTYLLPSAMVARRPPNIPLSYGTHDLALRSSLDALKVDPSSTSRLDFREKSCFCNPLLPNILPIKILLFNYLTSAERRQSFLNIQPLNTRANLNSLFGSAPERTFPIPSPENPPYSPTTQTRSSQRNETG